MKRINKILLDLLSDLFIIDCWEFVFGPHPCMYYPYSSFCLDNGDTCNFYSVTTLIIRQIEANIVGCSGYC